MNKESQKLSHLLVSTAEAIEYAATLIPKARWLESPPHGNHPKADPELKGYFGDWSAGRLLFHLVHYEENYALPSMQLWAEPRADQNQAPGGQPGEEESWQAAGKTDLEKDTLLGRFRAVRAKQIQLLRAIPDGVLQEERSTGWGDVNALFVVGKTVQHTLEHGNDLLKNALYWEIFLDWFNNR